VGEGNPTLLIETKLHAPPVRSQLVGRDRLLESLNAGAGRRLGLVACPAGFGKTNMLAAWVAVEASRRPMAWVTIDRVDNDPTVLWTYLLEALRRACPGLDDRATTPVPAASPLIEVILPRLVNALAEQGSVTLILDDFHLLTDGRARESINWLVTHAPPTFQLVLSTRREPDLPLATLRAHGDVVELRAEDLRFTDSEADEFLNDRQLLGLPSSDVELLVERTSGWPAGIYLAALSLRRAQDRHSLIERFGASNRHVTDFLESEVMEAHDPADREAMIRCSVLDRLSGPLCDAVLERTGMGETLRRLSRSNLFLVPLDEAEGWYGLHLFFAQLLRVELEREAPELVVELHRRAFSWHAMHGDTSEAIDHAVEAGMCREGADLVAATWDWHVNRGRYDTVLAWVDRFPVDFTRGDVGLLLARAWALSLSGHREEAQVSIALAEGLVGAHPGPLPDGFSSAEASLLTLKGVFPWGDLHRAHIHASRAVELEGPDGRWRAVALWGLALAPFYRGEPVEADTRIAEVAALAAANGHWLVAASAVGCRALIAADEGRIEVATLLAERSIALAREHGVQDTVAVPTIALGVSLTARARHEEAMPVLEHGVAVARFRGQPLLLARALRHLAAAASASGQPEKSAAAAAEAHVVLAACVPPSMRASRTPGARAQAAGARLLEPLTSRELTILLHLAGDLSEAEIGRELFVSHSTVHSHVRSIYRKLGATSRAEAVEVAAAVGILESFGADLP
jgi:LuxR family maltose regulon positive regulatory protein